MRVGPTPARAPRLTALRRWLAACASLTLVLAVSAPGAAEVFDFRDGREVRGRILAEFDNLLFVKLDGGQAEFVHRAELKGIVDDEGQRHDSPPPGTFAPLIPRGPAGAVTDVVGEVRTTGAPQTRAPAFLAPQETVETGEAAFCRVVLPDGTVCMLSPESELTLPYADRSVAQLVRGEALVRTRLRPLELPLSAPLTAKAGPGAEVVVRQDDDTVHLQQEAGESSVRAPWLSMVVAAGSGVSLRQLTTGAWRITADAVNSDPMDLTLQGEPVELAPGESRVLGGAAEPEGELWRVVATRGELSVRKGEGRPFAASPLGQRERLVLGPGDALRTGAKASATLVRGVDGASLTLGERGTLEIAAVLEVLGGSLVVEALDAAVRVKTPVGVAAVNLVAVEFEPDTLGMRVHGVTGVARLPLGAAASLLLEPGARATLTREDAHVSRVEVRGGAAQVINSDARQARFRVKAAAGESVAVRARPGERTALLLPGERVLEFEAAPIDATLTLTPPTCRFPVGASFQMKEGLTLALGVDREHPQLIFRKGPRLTLMAAFAMHVQNPTLTLQTPDGRDVAIKLEGELAARLLPGGAHSLAALGLRESDLLEVSGAGDVSLDRSEDLTRFTMADGRKLWVQDGAPAVQSRLANGDRLVYLTMPGVAALGLKPNRAITVLATSDGEFVILDQESIERHTTELELLSGAQLRTRTPRIGQPPTPPVLDVPNLNPRPPASPSGP